IWFDDKGGVLGFKRRGEKKKKKKDNISAMEFMDSSMATKTAIPTNVDDIVVESALNESVTQPVRDTNVEQVTVDAFIHVHGSSNVEAACGDSDPIINVGNQVPITYETKLCQSVNRDKVNLRKLEANVPKEADYDVWLPLASVHEIND
ncbi:hypothetical protein Tco_1331843, partial [Tanacetum coccineum]